MGGLSAVRLAPLFSGVLPEDYKRISAVARVQEFKRHEPLYLEGDAVEQVFLLTSGLVKTTKLGPRGAEVILRVGVPGDVLGAMSSTGNLFNTRFLLPQILITRSPLQFHQHVSSGLVLVPAVTEPTIACPP
jgi:CRP-like cAMP-binding protein